MTPIEVGTIGVVVSALLATTGFVSFLTLARFWRSKGGWFVFWDLLMVTWILDLSSIAHIWNPPWFAWTRLATFAVGFPVLLAWRCWIIFDLQLWGPRRELRAYRNPDTAPEETHAA